VGLPDGPAAPKSAAGCSALAHECWVFTGCDRVKLAGVHRCGKLLIAVKMDWYSPPRTTDNDYATTAAMNNVYKIGTLTH